MKAALFHLFDEAALDFGLFIVQLALLALVYLVGAHAKNREGKKLGFLWMSRVWIYSLPYMVSSFIEFSVNGAGGHLDEVKNTRSTVFLWAIPVAIVIDIIRARRKRANQIPEPTSGLTPGRGSS